MTVELELKHSSGVRKLQEGQELAKGKNFYKALVSVFSSISGLVTVDQEGIIKNCNHNFSLMLFGYSEKDLVGKVPYD